MYFLIAKNSFSELQSIASGAPQPDCEDLKYWWIEERNEAEQKLKQGIAAF